TCVLCYRRGGHHPRRWFYVGYHLGGVLGGGGDERVDNTRLVGGAFRPRDQPVEGRRGDPSRAELEGHDDVHVDSTIDRITYAEAFQRYASIQPHSAPVIDLAARAHALLGDAIPDLGNDRDGWLELLLSHIVEPQLGRSGPTFVYDFPASQAALARIRPGDPSVAERFEAWVEGVELANGYHELTDPAEQRHRFETDLDARRNRGLPDVPVDHHLLAAMEHGLPDCAGVAIGVDRLVMLAAGVDRIDQVIAFPIDRA
ncbi:MAG: hypothetical protein QNL88_05180, partial [Acidobacteriota bacterium]|nr:hypothetical protein [Acidobacteriota bacterium]